ncbi:cRISPR-associated protein [Bacteroides sp. CAG:709]|nr:cRISPR-associated protein [Bacteroides sp. CAG:709]
MIKAPYNFVPLENKAFYPSWTNHISQDIPFEDGVSGSIEYTIEAKTPIFVRNGYTDREHPDSTFSKTHDGKFFIPSTSIKGEIRNVLEILSFGKMTQVQDARFGIRDLNSQKNPVAYVEGNFYLDKMKHVQCGWLYKRLSQDRNEEYIINDCGVPGRIKPEEIDNHYGTALAMFGQNLTLNRQCTNKNDEEELRSAYYKYKNILKISLDNQDINNCFCGTFSTVQDNYDRLIASFGANGKKGCIVVTGQPSKRDPIKKKGKYYEFVFFESENEEPIDTNVINDFLTIHKNNYDYEKIWKRYLNEGRRVPVFFSRKNGNNGPIDSIGLAYMFRIPTANFIKGAIPIELQSNRRKDLAECIFGTAKESLGQLKGRVNISHALTCGTPKECDDIVTTVLGSPKPSYGPLYASSGTWNDANAQIKGRKRYPVRTTLLPPNKGTDSQTCEFIPLDQGTSFKGRITFHNLKECELGALIAALTFNGHPECCHSIGEAKPLGYGKVKISIDKLSVISIKDIFAKTDDPTQQETDYYFNKFKDVMTENIGTGWENSNSIHELCAMARGIDEEVNNNFSYMRMSTNRNENEFALNKSEKKENLPTFSSILNNRVLHITERPDTNRLFKQDIDNDIEEEDSQSLARIDVIETYTVRVPHLITNRDFCKAEKIISEMKRDINGKIRNLADQYQDQIDKIRENDYSTSRDEVIHAFNETENIVNGLNGQLNDEDRNNLINRIEQHINSFTELSQRYPNHAIEFMELIGRCNTLIQRIRNYGNGILPFLPISPFKGTLKAYTGKIDKYLREYRVLTDHDKDLIYNNIIEIYPSINAREKHPKRGSWSIDSMNNTLIRYLGDTRTTQLIDTLTQQ